MNATENAIAELVHAFLHGCARRNCHPRIEALRIMAKNSLLGYLLYYHVSRAMRERK